MEGFTVFRKGISCCESHNKRVNKDARELTPITRALDEIENNYVSKIVCEKI